ncbi:MAG TPA: flagellar hook-associated protein FlgK [Nitrospira sp.]|nr:flagellar hook-associated protein FlgK [Nitrospira sp.]
MGLNGLLDVAKTALFTAQQALTVTGHNISNVNTPGFSRQEITLTENPPVDGSPGQVGTGVQIEQIRRAVDVFLNREITASQEDLGRFTIMQDELQRLEGNFGDTQDQGLAAQLNQFFQSLQDATTTPSEVSPRSVVLQNASMLSGTFHQITANLTDTSHAIDTQIGVTISEINEFTKQIAQLNTQIKSAQASGQNANDLQDQRDLAINNLATRIDVTTIDRPDGTVSVYAARGLVLVDQETTRNLVGVESSDNHGFLDVGYDMGGDSTSQHQWLNHQWSAPWIVGCSGSDHPFGSAGNRLPGRIPLDGGQPNSPNGVRPRRFHGTRFLFRIVGHDQRFEHKRRIRLDRQWRSDRTQSTDLP